MLFSRMALVSPPRYLDLVSTTVLKHVLLTLFFCLPSRQLLRFYFSSSLFLPMYIGKNPVGGSSTTTEIPEMFKNVVPVMDPEVNGYGGKN